MLRKLLVLLVIMGMSTVALADPVVGPIPAAGWGYDCTNWITYSDPWASGPMCYDPNYPGGDGWMVCGTGEQVVWPGLDIELWVEMECTFTWDRTHVQIHRYADYSDFYLYFNGTSSCNNGQVVITTPPTAVGSLDFLPFQEDMFGRTGPTYGTPIPLSWDYSLNGDPYLPMVAAGGNKQFSVDPCDHYFTIRVFVDMMYHQEDGYYYLGGDGASICPAEPM